MRSIVITERMREERREKRKQKLKKIDSSLLLLIWCCSRATWDFFYCVDLRLRSHTVTETIIRRPKEKDVCLTKERTSTEQVFVMSSLLLSLSLSRLQSFSSACCSYPQRRQIIWMHILVRSGFWMSGWTERQFDREKSWLGFIILFFLSFHLFLNCDIRIMKELVTRTSCKMNVCLS
jgi:hypothetical protein